MIYKNGTTPNQRVVPLAYVTVVLSDRLRPAGTRLYQSMLRLCVVSAGRSVMSVRGGSPPPPTSPVLPTPPPLPSLPQPPHVGISFSRR